tara:strand:+ start:716 stop:1198 length:483 start_codon:yes stop_codon:yes gene_type:complete
MSSIEIKDNFLEETDAKRVLEYCVQSSYTYGEVDTPQTPPTGMVHEIQRDEDIYKLFESKIKNYYRYVRKLNLYRMYVNCFSPSENPYFHTDGDKGVTFLYYVNDQWTLNEGGETQILVDDEIRGVLPLPNRIVGFNANLLHRATSFRNRHRFTLAVKFA